MGKKPKSETLDKSTKTELQKEAHTLLGKLPNTTDGSHKLIEEMTEKELSEWVTTAKTESPKPKAAPIPDPNDIEPPKPKFNGPLIVLKNIDVKAGGVVSVHCLDSKVPLNQIQIIQVKAGDATYVYRRI